MCVIARAFSGKRVLSTIVPTSGFSGVKARDYRTCYYSKLRPHFETVSGCFIKNRPVKIRDTKNLAVIMFLPLWGLQRDVVYLG
jgi:hypothetical protein